MRVACIGFWYKVWVYTCARTCVGFCQCLDVGEFTVQRKSVATQSPGVRTFGLVRHD